jgi:integrase/recombinase XerD
MLDMWVIPRDISTGRPGPCVEGLEDPHVCFRSVPDRAVGVVGGIGDPARRAAAGRVSGVRPNTVLAVAFDLKVFFGVVGKPPSEITSSDVLAFFSAQRAGGDGRSLRAIDDAAGLSARTVARRISTVAGLFAYLLARGDVPVNPVPRGLPTRRESYRSRPQVPLVRRPRTLPRILSPAEVDALLGALRTRRDVVMVAAMLLGGLRRCEVLGLRLGDVDTASKRVFIAHGKGGRQRQVAVSRRFFVALGDYLTEERPDTSSDALFVVLKGRRRGQPLSAYAWTRSSTGRVGGLG